MAKKLGITGLSTGFLFNSVAEIDLKKGIDLVRQLMKEHSDVSFSEESDKAPLFTEDLLAFTIDLLTIVMHNNYFHFGTEFYLQTKGTAMGTPAADHFRHLVLHGLLHLLGLDHQNEAEATHMETLETRLLATLSVADPYAGSVPIDELETMSDRPKPGGRRA